MELVNRSEKAEVESNGCKGEIAFLNSFGKDGCAICRKPAFKPKSGSPIPAKRKLVKTMM
ncbi:unnamed protein product, partial [Ilex paraguariensis]